MALGPHKADPNYAAQMKLVESGDYNSGAAGTSTVAPVLRVSLRLAAHYGLTAFETGRIGNVAKKLLDEAGGDTSKVRLDTARADLVKLLGPL